MLLSPDQFLLKAQEIADSDSIEAVAIDFETTGLRARIGDRAFIIGVCIDGKCFSHRLGQADDAQALMLLTSNPRIRYLAHNAKFELTFLKEQWGVEIKGLVWDTEVMARVERNNHLSYGLQKCAERIGESKYKPMLEWLEKHKHQYHLVPEDLIVPYVEQDARLSYILYKQQCATFRSWQHNSRIPISRVVELELKTTKNLFAMECVGLKLNVDYCTEALAYERDRAAVAAQEFERLTGVPFVDSSKTLKPIFSSQGLKFGKTEKGAASFAYDALKSQKDHPIVAVVLAHREALKRASTYWEGLLDLHIGGVIYPEIRQAGAASGRFSAAKPNVQNWPDDSEDPTCRYPIRRAFIAPEGCVLVSMDYSQMELRLIAEEAGELGMIADFKNGVDFHQKVADSAKVARGPAKNVRFAKLYGAGVPKMAEMLGLPIETVRRINEEIDSQSPRIAAYSDALIRYARHAGYGYNWLGRRYFFDRNFEYKYPNYRIQGGCAEIFRIALDLVADFLRKNARPASRCIVPIHDELVFRMDQRDLHLLPKIKELMIKAAEPMRNLKMDVSVSQGLNLHDLEEVKL